MNLIVRKVGDSIFHISESEKPSSMLTRYGIIDAKESTVDSSSLVTIKEDGVVLSANRKVDVSLIKYKKDYEIIIPLTERERLFGGGDSNRDNVMIRGSKLTMHIANVRSYGPMPIVLSSDGWAILLNTTYSSVFDCGKSDPDKLNIRVLGGELDFYLFRQETLSGLLGEVTRISGRPMILPKYAYGFQFIMNQSANLHELLEATRLFREKNIPCDSIGLEPDWMETHYDFTTEKRWNPEKFPLVRWQPANQSGRGTFFYPLRRMGMRLSLWLCEDYDLLYYEEGNAQECADDTQEFPEDAEILDPHLVASVWSDKITKRDERWFEHLKKFVDNGVSAFKLDGSNQVLAHPDRLWGGKYLDEEVHNVYPVLLVKEMNTGFKEYTDRRVLLNTAGAYIGTPRYAATWAGDTGGGPRTLVSLMNYSMCGHSNTSCDIDVHSPESMHYGFLMPWTQQNSWDYHYLPWYMGDEVFERFCYYSRLRSTLFPIIYSAAHTAYETGIPILRPLPLVYEDETCYDNTKNLYMLGDSLLVAAFDMHFKLPKGSWIDYMTGKVYEGGNYVDYVPESNRGGGLFVRSGDVIVTMKQQKYVEAHTPEYSIDLYPDTKESSFTIYEDDGETYDYQSGGYATTEVRSSGIKDGVLVLTVEARKGSFAGRPDNGHSITDNSIPKIDPIADPLDMTITVRNKIPSKVLKDGKEVNTSLENGVLSFVLSKEDHMTGDVEYTMLF